LNGALAASCDVKFLENLSFFFTENVILHLETYPLVVLERRSEFQAESGYRDDEKQTCVVQLVTDTLWLLRAVRERACMCCPSVSDKMQKVVG